MHLKKALYKLWGLDFLLIHFINFIGGKEEGKCWLWIFFPIQLYCLVRPLLGRGLAFNPI